MKKIKEEKVNVYLVARVSDSEQESNEAQIVRLRGYAEKKGFTKAKEYQIKESSSREIRKKFQEIIDEVANSKGLSVLIVDTIDRLQRSYKESVLFDSLRNDGKVELHFYRENLIINKNSNSADIIRWDMGVLFAKSYVLQLSDNVKRSFEQKRKDGCWTSKAPFGYNNIPKDREKRTRSDLVINENEAECVRSIFNKYAGGLHSLGSLCVWLKKENIKTKTNSNFCTSSLHQLLCNPFYHGVMKTSYGDFPHRYEPIIDKQLFFSVQKLLGERNNNPIKIRGKVFLFAGLFKCEDCGCSISAQNAKGKYNYYHCTNAKGNCKRIYINEDVIEKEVHGILDSIALTDEQVDEICDYVKKENDSQSLYQKNQIHLKQTEYQKCQTMIDKALDMLLEQKIDDATYEKKTSEMKNRQNQLTYELEGMQTENTNSHITARTVLELAQKAKELYESSKMEQKCEILNLIFQNSTIKGRKCLFKTRKPFNIILDVKGCPDLLRRQDSNLRQIDYTYSGISPRGGLYHHPITFIIEDAWRFDRNKLI